MTKINGEALAKLWLGMLLIVPLISLSSALTFGYDNPELPSVEREVSFIKDTGDSASGDYDFNGGWTNNGLTISGGDIYAQTGYFYNLSALDIVSLKVNGTIAPAFNMTYDLGNNSYWWRKAYIGEIDLITDVCILGGNCLSTVGAAGNSIAWNRTGTDIILHHTGDSVGIGTTSPAVPLEVNGSIFMTGSSRNFVAKAGNQIGFEDAAPTGTIYLYNDGGATSRLNIGGTMWVEEAGNVGIGTASPGNLFHIKGPAPVLQIENTVAGSSAAPNISAIAFVQSDGVSTGASIKSGDQLNSNSNNDLAFWTRATGGGASTEKVRITGSGNVGIGTTSPNLGVYGATSSVQTILGGSSSNPVGVLELGSQAADADGETYGDLAFVHGSTTDTAKRLSIIRGLTDGTTANNRGGQLQFFVQNDGADTFTNAMTIRESGNVGIGTASPAGKFEVWGGEADATSPTFSVDSTNITIGAGASAGNAFIDMRNRLGTTKFYVATAGDSYFTGGNVGIGTTSPNAPLHVLNAAATQVIIEDATGGGQAQILMNASSGVSTLLTALNDKFQIRHGSTGAEVATFVPSSGNVGIGTTGPTELLEVNGTDPKIRIFAAQGSTPYLRISENNVINWDISSPAGTGDLAFTDVGSGEKMRIESGGNVGIGTASPAGKLDVGYYDGANDNKQIISNAGGTGDAYIGLHNNVGNNWSLIKEQTSASFRIQEDGVASHLVILQGGNVGIGTTSPSHKLNVVGNQNLTGNFSGNQYYGEVYGIDAGLISIASSGLYYNVTNLTAGFNNGFDFNTTGSADLTTAYAGIYHITSQWAFSGGANTEYHLSIDVNGEQQSKCHTERVIGTGGDVGSASFTCFLDLNIGDYLNAVIENIDNTNDATIHNIQLNLVRIGN